MVASTRDLLPRLLASDRVGVACLDRQLRLRSWSRAWGECFGLAPGTDDVPVGEQLSAIVPPIAVPDEMAVERLVDGETLHLGALALESPDGTSHHDVMVMPLMGSGVEGFLHLVLDIGGGPSSVARAGERGETLDRSVLKYRRELSALRDVMSAAAESLELRDVLRRLLRHVLRVMKSRAGAIHLLDEDARSLQLAASLGVPKRVQREIETVAGPFEPTTWPNEGNELCLVPEIAERLRRSLKESGKGGAAACVGVPVRSRGENLGLISVVGRAGRAFDDEDVALLGSIADQIGVVVENTRLHRQAEQLAVVRERERLARELHDSVTQSLYSLTLLAEASQRLLGSGDSDRAAEHTGRLGEIAQQALREMRLLVYQLRPLVLKREGLVGALQQRLDAVEKRAGVDARLLVEGPLDLPAPVEEGLYRIAQEALNNALKHASPRSVILRIWKDGGDVVLEVEDDGRGFDPEAVSDQGGMGLTSMRERVERLGGTFSLVSALGTGTTVRVVVEVVW